MQPCHDDKRKGEVRSGQVDDEEKGRSEAEDLCCQYEDENGRCRRKLESDRPHTTWCSYHRKLQAKVREDLRCLATARTGVQCRNKPVNGTAFCQAHKSCLGMGGGGGGQGDQGSGFPSPEALPRQAEAPPPAAAPAPRPAAAPAPPPAAAPAPPPAAAPALPPAAAPAPPPAAEAPSSEALSSEDPQLRQDQSRPEFHGRGQSLEQIIQEVRKVIAIIQQERGLMEEIIAS